MSNELRGFIPATYDVKKNTLNFEYQNGGVKSELGIGISVPYYYLEDFAVDFKSGMLSWDNETHIFEVDLKHYIYCKYVRACKKGLLTPDGIYNKIIATFYKNLESNVYEKDLDLDEALILVQEFKNLFKR
jgi:hypothetical protein